MIRIEVDFLIINYVLAGLVGVLLSGITIIDFYKSDTTILRRVASVIINPLVMMIVCLFSVHYFGFTYRFIVYSMVAANLLYISNCDIREQSVSIETIAVSVICALSVLFWNRDNVWWNYILSGIGYTFVFMLVSRFSRNAIGQGDALIIGIIGLYLGFSHTFASLFFGLFLGGLFSIILFTMKKVSRHTPLPFAPFLTAGFIVSIIL